MSVSDKRQLSEKELSEFYENFMMAATRVHNFECSTGLPYTESAEYKKAEEILLKVIRGSSKYTKKEKS